MLTVDDLGFDAPSLSGEEVACIAEDCFGLSGDFEPLRGERDQNTRITDENGQQFVLKISGAAEAPATVDFQVKALLHIEATDPRIPVPRLVPGKDGSLVYSVTVNGETHQVRLMSYLPGIPYAQGPYPSPEGLRQIGKFIARLDIALAGFSHPASTEFMAWDICNGLVISSQFRDLIPAEANSLCDPLLQRIEQFIYPQLDGLRKQVIHQDGHGDNLLRVASDSEDISGIIDFGDMIHGPLISDVVISASHFMETGDNPVEIATAVCHGFHSVSQLKEEEIDLLLDLVITRQILTLQLFEFRRLYLPHEPPLDPEEKPRIVNSLQRLARLDAKQFASRIRAGIRQ